jgi:hypothetical protein
MVGFVNSEAPAFVTSGLRERSLYWSLADVCNVQSFSVVHGGGRRKERVRRQLEQQGGT